jgi:hypothetical protein
MTRNIVYKICQLKIVKKNGQLQNMPIKEIFFCTKKKVIPFSWKRLLVTLTYNNKLQKNMPIKENLFFYKKNPFWWKRLVAIQWSYI